MGAATELKGSCCYCEGAAPKRSNTRLEFAMALQASKELQTFPNPHPNNAYTIKFATTEFTTL